MEPITYDIKEKLGVLSESTNGWSRQLNIVSWNDNPPKYDIRSWNSNYSKMGKGITLSLEELKILKDLLDSMDI